ncbi:Ankyrin repeat domain-containing protein [Tetrabaena socialis]|uniref:Ankyrin repeat domain-containing protein n=1 Tax=Tetrabaena socialis TaxID=47790 RepID=A0A2J8AH79_9CHLO|nr:Ankyrin repeat domain-containing protein [Tetrabaena socialis]|eukprot:PNH11884.1 Ankyrin repeat domain-containing protein [Tetrabaena socialis]
MNSATSSLDCPARLYASGSWSSAVPASPAQDATTAGDAGSGSGPPSLGTLPTNVLQLVLIAAGAGALPALLASSSILAAWRSLVTTPHLAARWLRFRYGSAQALEALARLPLDRYLSPGALTTPSRASSAVASTRVHILGYLLEAGCDPRQLHPAAAATLVHDACVAGAARARALLAAVERNHSDCVRELLAGSGADPCASESLALRVACKAGALESCEAMLAAAAASAAAGGPSHSVAGLTMALAQASVCGHGAVQAALLRAARSPAALAGLALISVAGSDKATAGAVAALVSYGADAAAYGSKALKAACQQPSPASYGVVLELLRHGADARADGSEALVLCCRASAPPEAVASVARALLEAGADAGAQEGAALRFACKAGACGAAAALLAAPPGAHGLFGLSTALAEAAVGGHASVAEACLAAVARHRLDPQAVRDLALLQCCQVGSLPAVNCLLTAGASPGACASKGLILAAEAGNGGVVAALLAAGADPGAGQGAAVAAAARRGHTGIVQALLAAGADPCARDSWALWVASEAGHLETVGVLLGAGADPTIEDAGLDMCELLECDEMDCDPRE